MIVIVQEVNQVHLKVVILRVVECLDVDLQIFIYDEDIGLVVILHELTHGIIELVLVLRDIVYQEGLISMLFMVNQQVLLMLTMEVLTQ